MKLFGFSFGKSEKSERADVQQQEETEELFVVPIYKPCKLPQSQELLWRQRVETVRKKYCCHTEK